MAKTLSEWRLQMSDNSIAQKLDNITRAGDKASRSFTSLQTNMVKAENASSKFGNKISGFFGKIGSSISNVVGEAGNLLPRIPLLSNAFVGLAGPVGLAVVALTAFVAIAAAGTQKAAALEQQVADLSAITGIAGSDLNYLSDESIKLAGETGIAATDIVESYKLLASNIDVMAMGGVAALESLSKATITLAQASGTTLPEAADTMSFAINQFKLNAFEANRVINVLAAGAKYGAAEIPDLAASLKVAGVTAQGAGVSIETTVAAIEALSKVGIKGGEAGTGLRNVLLRLQTEEIPGVNLRADGLIKTLQKLEPKMQDVTFLTKTFGMENVNAAQALIGNISLLNELETKVTGTSVAQEQAAIRTNTFNATVSRFRETWNGLLITVGEKLLPVMTNLFEKATQFINWLGEKGNPVVEHFTGVWELSITPLKIAWNFITDLTSAFGGFGEAVSGATGFLGDFLRVGINIFSSFAKLVSGVMVNVAGMLNPVNWFRPGKMKEYASELVSTVKDFGSNIGNAFTSGIQDAAEKNSAGASNPFSQYVGADGPVMPGTGTPQNGSSSAITNGIDNITGGGKSVRNVTVNIQKLVEQINIMPAQLKEGVNDIQRMVEEALIRAVQGTEIAISND